jgi:hypothetical protein
VRGTLSFPSAMADTVTAVYGALSSILRTPAIKAKVPSIERPSWKVVFGFVLLSYFLVAGGIIYGEAQGTGRREGKEERE